MFLKPCQLNDNPPFLPKPSAEPPRLPSPTSRAPLPPHQEQEGWEKVSELQCTTAASPSTFSTFSTRYQHHVMNRNRLAPIPPPHPGRLRWHVVALSSKEVVWELQSCRAPSCRNTDCPGVDTSPPRPVKSGEVGGGGIKGF